MLSCGRKLGEKRICERRTIFAIITTVFVCFGCKLTLSSTMHVHVFPILMSNLRKSLEQICLMCQSVYLPVINQFLIPISCSNFQLQFPFSNSNFQFPVPIPSSNFLFQFPIYFWSPCISFTFDHPVLGQVNFLGNCIFKCDEEL